MISIIIPTLNEARALEKTITQFQHFTAYKHEIIVSDGNSTDGTIKIAGRFADKTVVYKEITRQTISLARNMGAEIARGDYFVFLDADCVIKNPNEFFKIALSRFEMDPKIVALTARLQVLPEYETWADRMVFGTMNFFLNIENNYLGRGEATGEFQMIRRDAFLRVHGYRNELVTREDADMFFRLSRVGKTHFEKAITTFHTGRRAHTVGWPRLIAIWALNTFMVAFFNKAYSKEWTVIR